MGNSTDNPVLEHPALALPQDPPRVANLIVTLAMQITEEDLRDLDRKIADVRAELERLENARLAGVMLLGKDPKLPSPLKGKPASEARPPEVKTGAKERAMKFIAKNGASSPKEIAEGADIPIASLYVLLNKNSDLFFRDREGWGLTKKGVTEAAALGD